MPSKVVVYAVKGGRLCRQRWSSMPSKVVVYAVKGGHIFLLTTFKWGDILTPSVKVNEGKKICEFEKADGEK
jgi:hypothetical protein